MIPTWMQTAFAGRYKQFMSPAPLMPARTVNLCMACTCKVKECFRGPVLISYTELKSSVYVRQIGLLTVCDFRKQLLNVDNDMLTINVCAITFNGLVVPHM